MSEYEEEKIETTKNCSLRVHYQVSSRTYFSHLKDITSLDAQIGLVYKLIYTNKQSLDPGLFFWL